MVDNARIHDGSRPATIRSLTGANPLDVALVDGAGNQVTSFGGGTQYTEGQATTTSVVTAAGGKQAGGSAAALQLDAGKNLLVTINSSTVAMGGGTQYVEGTAAAAGTGNMFLGKQGSNTVTSLLANAARHLVVEVGTTTALPAGANIIGKVEISAATSTAVTNAGTFAVQATIVAATSTSVTNAGTFAVQATIVAATSTAVTNAGVFAVQATIVAATSTAVTNAGTFAVQATIVAATSTAVTNAGTFAVQDSQAIADDAAFGVASSKVFAAGFLADESAPDSVDEGDVGAARMTLDRKQHVAAELESSSLRAGGTALTPKFAPIAVASSGNNTMVAAVAAKKIRVLSMAVVATAAVSVFVCSDTTTSVIFGGSTNKIALAANGGFVLPFSPLGWFETGASTGAILNLSGAVAVSGGLTYVEV